MVRTLEDRASDLEMTVYDVPRLVNIRFDRVHADIDELKAKVTRLQADMTEVKSELRVLPRVLSELIAERDRQRDES